MKKKITIILLNWNGLEDTLRCIKSCKKLHYKADLIVVDNGSQTSDVLALKKVKGITLLLNEFNLGFAEGNNVGIRYALKKGADGVFLLNNDTIIEEDALTLLAAKLFSDDAVGIVGPKIFFWDKKTIWFAGGIINYFVGDAKHIGAGKKDSLRFSKESPVDYITGAGMLVKKEVFNHIGLLDKDFFAFYEELDFNARATKRNYAIWYVPEAIVHHKVSASAGRSSPLLIRLTMRNRLLFMRKNAPFWSWLTFPFFYGITFFGLIIFKLIRGDMEAAKAGILGTYQGITQKI